MNELQCRMTTQNMNPDLKRYVTREAMTEFAEWCMDQAERSFLHRRAYRRCADEADRRSQCD